MTRHTSQFGSLNDRVHNPPPPASAPARAEIHRRTPTPVVLSNDRYGLLVAWAKDPEAGWWGQVVTIRNHDTDPSVSWTWYPQGEITPLLQRPSEQPHPNRSVQPVDPSA